MSAFFSKADVKEGDLDSVYDVCFRPKADIRIFPETMHKADSLTVNTSALAPESGHSKPYLSEINVEGAHLRVERDSVHAAPRAYKI